MTVAINFTRQSQEMILMFRWRLSVLPLVSAFGWYRSFGKNRREEESSSSKAPEVLKLPPKKNRIQNEKLDGSGMSTTANVKWSGAEARR
jgi:hypothetical protein